MSEEPRSGRPFRPAADAFPVFVQLTCAGEEYHLWAQQIVDCVDDFDAACAALQHRAEALLHSHEVNAEHYVYSWEVFWDPQAVTWARHLFGASGVESFVLACPPKPRPEEAPEAPLAARPAPYVPPTTVRAADLEAPWVEDLAGRLSTAAIAHQMRVSYQTADKYRKAAQRVGDKWRLLALACHHEWLPVVSADGTPAASE